MSTDLPDDLLLVELDYVQMDQVLTNILENATRICGAKFGMLFRYEDGFFHLVASLNLPPLLADFMSRQSAFAP